MNPLVYQLLTSLVVSLIGTAGVVLTHYLLVGSLNFEAILAYLLVCSAISFVLIEWLLFGRVRKLTRRLRNQLSKKSSNGPSLSLPKPKGDPVHSLYQIVLKSTGAMRREFAEMKETEVFRREFLGDVSHELKTPIFAIQGFIETLLDGAMNDKKVNRKFLKKALKNVNRLESMVQDLLTISQLETGDLKLEMGEFRLYEVVLDVFEAQDYKSKKTSARAELNVEANGLENQYVIGDRGRIQQVLDNLVTNAIKYGREEGGIVTVNLNKLGSNGKSAIQVAVNDNGPGIATEHLDHIFQRFYRIDKSRSRERGGTGLGLSIVKYLLEAHEQDIQVESEQNVGTTFYFTLEPVRS